MPDLLIVARGGGSIEGNCLLPGPTGKKGINPVDAGIYARFAGYGG
jgi:hypothetical protein